MERNFGLARSVGIARYCCRGGGKVFFSLLLYGSVLGVEPGEWLVYGGLFV